LLKELGKKPLGFEEGIVPDGEWLYRVARFVDPWNLCCLFDIALQAPEAPKIDSQILYAAQRAREQALLIDTGLDNNEIVVEKIQGLELAHKRWRASQAELAALINAGKKIEEQVKKDYQEMNS
jgi:hypothetical protein